MKRFLFIDFDGTIIDNESNTSVVSDEFDLFLASILHNNELSKIKNSEEAAIRDVVAETCNWISPLAVKIMYERIKILGEVPRLNLVKSLYEKYRMCSMNRYELFKNVASTFTELKKKGCVIVVCTDGDYREKAEILDHTKINALVDFIFSPEILGVRKNSGSFYSKVFEELSKSFLTMSKRDVLVFGNDFNLDYLAALREGFHSVLFTTSNNHPDVPSYHKVNDIFELTGMFVGGRDACSL